MNTQSKLFKAAARTYGWLHDKAPFPFNRLRTLLDGWMAKREEEQKTIDKSGVEDCAPLLILQFKPEATEPTESQSRRLREWLRAAFPDRTVVLLPCGVEVAPACQLELRSISQKLDALIDALVEEDVVENIVSVSLSGEPLGRERDQTKGLG